MPLTSAAESVGETEVVHRVKGQQVIQKLFPLILTAQEGITFVQAPVNHTMFTQTSVLIYDKHV